MIKRALPLLMLFAGLAGALPSSATDPGGWFVVRYEGTIRSADRAALERAGARAILYRHPDSYVARLSAEAAGAIADNDGVRSVRSLRPEEKIASPGHDGPISVIAAAGPGSASVRARLERIGPVARANVTPDGLLEVVLHAASPEQVRRVAGDPDVLTIGRAASGIVLYEEATAQVVAGNIQGGRPVAGYRSFLDDLGLGGAGVRIAIADSGIDDTHPDLAGRVAARTDFTPFPDYRDSDGHGTHVAGIAGGSGAGLPMGGDRDGLIYGMGVAPDVTLIDIGVIGILEEVAGVDEQPPFAAATTFAVQQGASAWNASWGSGEGDRAGYVQSARTLDGLVRDADPSTPGAQPLIMVFAAGNSGSSGLGAPTEAKNLIVAAASRSVRAGSVESIAGFSARGPTVDGRVGPTVAAPGEEIVSTRALPASVLCNVPPRDRTPTSPFYGLCSGTSMAAPHVTGAVAVLTNWWQMGHDGAVPSPAMARALLVNSATDMGPANIPNGAEGWGRVDLGTLFDPSTERVSIDQAMRFDEPGDTITLRVAAVDPAQPLKVTIAWSDAPAAPNAAVALVNDLDLRVTDEHGAVLLGNVFAGGLSTLGGSPDRRETLENVFIPSPDGTYTIEISAANLPGDGIPFEGDATDQDVALTIANAVIVGP